MFNYYLIHVILGVNPHQTGDIICHNQDLKCKDTITNVINIGHTSFKSSEHSIQTKQRAPLLIILIILN